MDRGRAPVATAGSLDPALKRAAALYRRVDHREPGAVRREAARRIRVARAAGLWAATDPAVEVEDLVAPGGAGADVAVRVYRPSGAPPPRPVVLYLHGGAFISGDLDFEHPRCLEMCRETGFVVVSVDYRLAPEHPYPAGLDDCLTAYRWVRAEGRSMMLDPDRVAVAGTSAGGGLAAALCLRARDTRLPLPRLQMLLFPVLSDRLDTPSMRAFADTPVWDSGNCAHMWRHYLGDPDRAAAAAYAAPARADDLSGLPATYLMTAEFDPLRDEGTAYASRLTEAGVSTELHQFPGTFHGFDTLATAPVSRRARREHHDVLWAVMS